jgi:hypoxanthine phosphoribosyltransferase
MIAIGGGGYVPARILRSFLKQPGSPNIPIQAIGLSLYEQLPSTHPSSSSTPGQVEQPGTKVTRTQWLDLTSLGEMENLVGKRILIVDEVDDTRTTLEYAVKELEKDVEAARQKLGYEGEPTKFSIFVLHVRQYPKPCFRTCISSSPLMNIVLLEQEQGEEGISAGGHVRRKQIPRGANRWGRLDLLSLGRYVFF